MNHYLMRIRYKSAQTRLASGEYKVEDVPEVCGFTDAAHLYKRFKEILGFPPSHYLPKGNPVV
jgi:transcriptional regulator GlxA family with amidase domain